VPATVSHFLKARAMDVCFKKLTGHHHRHHRLQTVDPGIKDQVCVGWKPRSLLVGSLSAPVDLIPVFYFSTKY
jgi:hypothetical protein